MAVGRAVIAALTLWGHALAALLFGVLALAQWRRRGRQWPYPAFVVALALTALWALASAGIDPRDVVTRIVEAARDAAWLGVMLALVRRDRAGGYALGAVYVVVMTIVGVAAVLALVEIAPLDADAAAAVASARVAFRMMAAAGALVLVNQLHQAVAPPSRGGIRLVVLALAAMWGMDLMVFAARWVQADGAASLAVVRGVGMAGVGMLLTIATHRDGDWTLQLSRSATMRTLSATALMIYAGLTILGTTLAAQLGEHARLAQTAVVLGATTALLTLVSTPWLRAWTRVKIAKHLFRHRYDYRGEWLRFTATLGSPGEGSAPLGQRVVKAVADLTDSPAGLLLVAEAGGLVAAAGWRWADGGEDGGAALAQHLTCDPRIIELDAVRRGAAPVLELECVPGWMLARTDAWAIVPLVHVGTLVGAILLATPPVPRPLDWEDFDLLRVAGSQAASYLAEDRAHAALADAARFDEFNRRFAFILHDIKNLVSQLTLVARNAERHADNPAFRADMTATLKDSATRMTALLARLSQHHAPSDEPVRPVDVAALLAAIARSRRAQHPVEVAPGAAVFAATQPARLEQVLAHLVQNAIEASAPASPVRLSATTDGTRTTIAVADTGCGMASGFVRDQLFRPFVSSKPGGFGIGAFEARQLVEAMGGTLSVDSREGEGTCFRIVLPAARALEVAA